MKTILASILLAFALAIPVKAQNSTNNTPLTPPWPIPIISFDWLDKLPLQTNFLLANLGVDVGLTTRAENFVKLDGYFKINWMVSVEIQNGPASSVVDAIGIHAGYRKAWANAEVYAQIGGRRTWANDAGSKLSYQGTALLGASWIPTTGGRWMIGAEVLGLTSDTGSVLNSKMGIEGRAYIKALF